MTISQRSGFRLLLAALLAVAMVALTTSPARGGAERTYRVTVTNLTAGQPMTPFVVAAHSGSTSIFRSGTAASPGLQAVAENGMVPVLVAELEGNDRVGAVSVAGMAPVAPGQSVSTEITVTPGARKISLAGMLICTNDGFAALNAAQVNASGKTQTAYGLAYDAGTEINTEDYDDLVPPCDGAGQSGMTNPDLAENGVVHHHAGILGIADLTPGVHGWSGPVIKVVIEPIG